MEVGLLLAAGIPAAAAVVFAVVSAWPAKREEDCPVL